MNSFFDLVEKSPKKFKLDQNIAILDVLETLGQDSSKGYVELKNYIDQLNIAPQLKKIILEEHLSSSSYVYLIYPKLFAAAYGLIDAPVIDLLCISGFFHFMAVKCFDDLIDASKDSKSNPSKEAYITSLSLLSFYNEHAIKTLGECFKSTHEIWREREIIYDQFFQFTLANAQETPKVKSIEEYENFACDKSRISFFTLEIFYRLSELKEKEAIHHLCNRLNRILTFILQIHDDIKDIEEDIENGQFNIFVDFASQNNIEHSAKEVKTYCYKEGVFVNFFQLVLINIQEGKEITNQLNKMDHVNFFLQKNHNKTVKEILNIKGYHYFIQHNNSDKNIQKINDNNSSNAYRKGIDYILDKQEGQGNWFDIFNNAGLSDLWSTAFILSNISSADAVDFSDNTNRALRYLIHSMNEDLGWGYNSVWISDTDSTSFVLLAMLKHQEKIDEKIFTAWIKKQQEDGGFTTYSSVDRLSISLGMYVQEKQLYKGWIQSHFCVSATAFYVLSQIEGYDLEKQKLNKYLINCFETGQSFSYWWTNSIYGYTYILKGLKHAYEEPLYNWVVKLIDKKFLNDLAPEIKEIRDNNFYLSLLIESLVIIQSITPKEKFLNKIVELQQLLLTRQLTDGSWASSPTLRITSPEIIDPRDKEIDWQEKTIGANTLYRDFNRLFTTVCSSNAVKITS